MADPLANLPPDVSTPETTRGRILVIDDEPDIRESLEALLSQRKLSRRAGRATPPKG